MRQALVKSSLVWGTFFK